MKGCLKKLFVLAFFALTFISNQIFCTTYPTDPANDILVYETPHTIGNEDTYKNFVLFKAGFNLTDGTVLLEIDPPVHDYIFLETNSDLIMNDFDLRLTITALELGGAAKMYGNTITTTCHMLSDMLLTSGGNNTLELYQVILNGNGNSLILDDSGGASITVPSDLAKRLTLQNIVIKNLDTSNIIMEGADSRLTLENTVLELGNDFTFYNGTIVIKGDVVIKGPHTITFNTLEIEEGATLYFDQDTTCGGITTLTMNDISSFLHFNGCTISGDISTSPNNGIILLENKVNINDSLTVNFSNADLIKVLAGARVILGNNSTFNVG
jgi:hypothetical protein